MVAAIFLMTSGRFVNNAPSTGEKSARVPCINPSLPIPEQYHIHPRLRIVVNDADVPTPANIGKEPGCERVVHTHEANGTIHIEPNFYQEFTLGDFFAVWGKDFSKDRILAYAAGQNKTIRMFVDSQESDQFQNLVLKDKQEVVIEYR